LWQQILPCFLVTPWLNLVLGRSEMLSTNGKSYQFRSQYKHAFLL
jgi:hypothetical protein